MWKKFRDGSSTRVELLAISKARLLVKFISPQPVFILADSCCAMRVIGRPCESIIAPANRNAIKVLEGNDFGILIQRLPSHSAILGNEEADRFGAEAHRSQPSVRTTATPRAFCRTVQVYTSCALLVNTLGTMQQARSFSGRDHSPPASALRLRVLRQTAPSVAPKGLSIVFRLLIFFF